jgi:hypothetical protein
MEEEITIIKISGTDPELYPLVGPLVMDANVLKENNNYPFKTSSRYIWYIAKNEQNQVVGFFPLCIRANYWLLDNYYTVGDSAEVLKALLGALSTDISLEAMAHVRHVELFLQSGFELKYQRTRYARMTRFVKEEKEEEESEKDKKAKDKKRRSRK